ncbi:hypothetical protein [Priestia aryabhattai]|uniref:hypothetical protein n=1 Tax=Priestia aryabhattai TaxID=412384 RepID=UPI001ADAE08C|nr:hypothetical protein [Priestia aryabhattai]QTL51297.1 hypothetical protein J5Z55_09560 [Priestia aryabhattai]
MVKVEEVKRQLFKKIFHNDLDEFVQEANSENTLYAILRGHLYIEREIVKLLNLKLENPKQILNNNFGFANKIRLAAALGFIETDSMEAYIAFNTVRNKYAHQLNYELNEKDLKKIRRQFCSSLESEYVRGVLTPSTSFLKKESFSNDGELSLIARFRGMTVILWRHLKGILYERVSKEIDDYLKIKEKEIKSMLRREMIERGVIKIDESACIEEEFQKRAELFLKNVEEGLEDIIKRRI